jgi:hypothetical protein
LLLLGKSSTISFENVEAVVSPGPVIMAQPSSAAGFGTVPVRAAQTGGGTHGEQSRRRGELSQRCSGDWERDRLGRFQPVSRRLAPAANDSLFSEPSAHAECLRREVRTDKSGTARGAAEGGGRDARAPDELMGLLAVDQRRIRQAALAVAIVGDDYAFHVAIKYAIMRDRPRYWRSLRICVNSEDSGFNGAFPLGFVGDCGRVAACRNAFQSNRMFATGGLWFAVRASRCRRFWSSSLRVIPLRTFWRSIQSSGAPTCKRAWITLRALWAIISLWSGRHQGLSF